MATTTKWGIALVSIFSFAFFISILWVPYFGFVWQGTPNQAVWISAIATLIGSIGTVGTLIAAIWLARRDSSLRHKEAYAIAVLAAADLQHEFQQLSEQIEKATQSLSTEEDGLVLLADIDTAIKHLHPLRVFSGAKIQQLAPLGQGCALTIFAMQNGIKNALIEMDKCKKQQVERRRQGFLVKGVATMIVSYPLSVLEGQQKRLDGVIKIIRNAIQQASSL